MTYVYGPVPSRRLGLSLGIDLITRKTCTYDCLYCQVGKTTCHTIKPGPFVPVKRVLEELEKVLEKTLPDIITLAGSGEPTLNSEIGQIISLIKKRTDIKVALLTNGSLLWSEAIRERIKGADIIMPTLSTVFENTFRAIHRPHQGLELPMIIEGLKNLRHDFRGLIFLEVVFLAGFNDSDGEIKGLKRVIDEISPEKIQLNTVVRPPSDPGAVSLDRGRLEEIEKIFGEKAEIIVNKPLKKRSGKHASRVATIIEMSKRRPIRLYDIANVLNISPEETESMVKELLIKGDINMQEHKGEIFYTAE